MSTVFLWASSGMYGIHYLRVFDYVSVSLVRYWGRLWRVRFILRPQSDETKKTNAHITPVRPLCRGFLSRFFLKKKPVTCFENVAAALGLKPLRLPRARGGWAARTRSPQKTKPKTPRERDPRERGQDLIHSMANHLLDLSLKPVYSWSWPGY